MSSTPSRPVKSKYASSRRDGTPFFSICIPQYNRTSFLIAACRSLEEQHFTDFEVCIADDCSSDGREAELVEFLEQSNLSFVYRQNEANLRYDGNLRASIKLANGKFCFLLGNDDALASPSTLGNIHSFLENGMPVGVAISNYQEYDTGKQFRRMQSSGVIGSGPRVAASYFRDFSFVSGIVFDTKIAQALATDRWDGSEMYQMYLGCRIIAAGNRLMGIDEVCVRKDIRITGEEVDSYAAKRLSPGPIVARKLPLCRITLLVADALAPYQHGKEGQKNIEKVATKLLTFTYPFWLIEYRRVQSWRYSCGVFLGMNPRDIFQGVHLSIFRRIKIRFLYAAAGFFGLLVPVRWFRNTERWLYAMAKAFK